MKKVFNILFILSIFLFGITTCKATVTTYDREQLDNYGVNKKWEITDENKDDVLNTKKVDETLKIYDFSDVLTDDEEALLKEKIDEFISYTNMDMVIVIDDFSYYNDEENEEYAANFYDYNDFGIDFENYSGVLLLRNTNSYNKYYNIYTFGNAQLYFSYERLEMTLDNMYYDFSSSDTYGSYYNGMLTFINDMMTYYEQGIPNSMRNYKVDENGYLYEVYKAPWFIITVLSAIITAIIIFVLVKKNKMVTKATSADNYYVKDSLVITNQKEAFIRSHTSRHVMSHGSGNNPGARSSRGSSGGGHGRGGGRHG